VRDFWHPIKLQLLLKLFLSEYPIFLCNIEMYQYQPKKYSKHKKRLQAYSSKLLPSVNLYRTTVVVNTLLSVEHSCFGLLNCGCYSSCMLHTPSLFGNHIMVHCSILLCAINFHCNSNVCACLVPWQIVCKYSSQTEQIS
jgi:hypothetical protein